MAIVDESIVDECRNEVESVDDQHMLDQVKSKYLGNKSIIKDALKGLSSMDVSLRAKASASINSIKKEIAQIIFSRKEQLVLLQTEKALKKDK